MHHLLTTWLLSTCVGMNEAYSSSSSSSSSSTTGTGSSFDVVLTLRSFSAPAGFFLSPASSSSSSSSSGTSEASSSSSSSASTSSSSSSSSSSSPLALEVRFVFFFGAGQIVSIEIHRLPNHVLRGASASESSSSPKSETSESWYLEGHSVSLVVRRVRRWSKSISFEKNFESNNRQWKYLSGCCIVTRSRDKAAAYAAAPGQGRLWSSCAATTKLDRAN